MEEPWAMRMGEKVLLRVESSTPKIDLSKLQNQRVDF